MLIIRPQPRCCMCGATALAQRRVANNFGVDIFEQCALISLGQRAAHQAAGSGGVVYQDVNAPEFCEGGFYQACHRFPARGIGDYWHNAPSSCLGECPGRLFQGLTMPGADHHVYPFLRQFLGNGLANTLTASSYDGDSPRQF